MKRKTSYRGPFYSCNNGMPSEWTNSYRILICKAWKNTRHLLIVISLLDGVLSYKWIRFCFNPQVSSFYWLLLIYITKQCLNQIFSEIFFSDPKVCKGGISLWYIIYNLLILCCIIFISSAWSSSSHSIQIPSPTLPCPIFSKYSPQTSENQFLEEELIGLCVIVFS